MSLIFVETITGEILRAFTWNGRLDEGVAKARLETERLGRNTVRIWTKKVH